MKDLKARFKQSRIKAGLSQTELAKEIGVSQGLISQIERGNVGHTIYMVEFANILDVDAGWLAFGSKAKRPKRKK